MLALEQGRDTDDDLAAADAVDDAALQRLVASAMPLFKRLDAEQKRDAIKLARSLGISSLAFAF